MGLKRFHSWMIVIPSYFLGLSLGIRIFVFGHIETSIQVLLNRLVQFLIHFIVLFLNEVFFWVDSYLVCYCINLFRSNMKFLIQVDISVFFFDCLIPNYHFSHWIFFFLGKSFLVFLFFGHLNINSN